MWKIVMMIIALNSQGVPVVQMSKERQDDGYRNAAECNRALLSQSPQESDFFDLAVKERTLTGRWLYVGCAAKGPERPLTEDEKTE